MGYQVKQSSTARPLLFLMVDSSDHLSPKTGLNPTVTLSKNGGAFAAPAGAVSEVGSGWYKVAGNATDNNTLGPLVLHATAAGADVVDEVFDVVAYDPADSNALGLARLDTNIGSRSSHTAAQVRAEMDSNSTRLASIDAGVATIESGVAGVKATTDKVDTMLEETIDLSGDYRFDVAALANVPTNNSPGVLTLLDRIGSNLAITDGRVDVNDKTGFSLDEDQRVKLAAAQPDYAPARAGDAMTLTAGERTAIANEVEVQIIDDTDSEKVLAAITNKIAAVNPSLSGLTLSAIASAVWSAVVDSPGITTLLARLTAQRATNLDNVDVATSSRLASAGYTAPNNAGIASANTALSAIQPVTDKLAGMIEADGPDYRFDANALEQAPTSSGGFTDDDRSTLTAIKGRADLIQTSHITIANNVTRAGKLLVLRRGTTWKIILTDLGSLEGRSKLYFTLKKSPNSTADSKALCQISEQDGLVYLNGAQAQTATEGSILVTDEAAGNVEIKLKASASKEVSPATDLYYDVKVIFADRADGLVAGTAQVVADVTRATS